MIWWDQPGYVVAFTTRVGGVSDAPFDSLNLSRETGDEPERGRGEPPDRMRCDRLPFARLAFNRQVHSPTVHRAEPGARRARRRALDRRAGPADARDVRRLPADRRRRGDDGRPALAVLHAGWRGLPRVLSRPASRRSATGRKAAVIGPAIGPCCYEVGPEVSAPLRRRPDPRRPSTSGRLPNAHCARPASTRSSASTSARATTRRSSSRTGATDWRAASRG